MRWVVVWTVLAAGGAALLAVLVLRVVRGTSALLRELAAAAAQLDALPTLGPTGPVAAVHPPAVLDGLHGVVRQLRVLFAWMPPQPPAGRRLRTPRPTLED